MTGSSEPMGSVLRLVVGAAVVGALGGCSGQAPTSSDVSASRRSADVGQMVDITLQNIGPGEYAAPPDVSSPAVRYLSVALVAPYVPAGETQRFSFAAVQAGQAIVTFHKGDRVVVDTIMVR